MSFKAKLRKVGNSIVVTVPTRYLEGFMPGEEIELDVVGGVYTEPVERTKNLFNTEMCSKHSGSMKGTCGCN